MGGLVAFLASAFGGIITYVGNVAGRKLVIVGTVLSFLAGLVASYVASVQSLIAGLIQPVVPPEFQAGLALLPGNLGTCVSALVAGAVLRYAHQWAVRAATLRAVG